MSELNAIKETLEKLENLGRPVDERRRELLVRRVQGFEMKDIVPILAEKYKRSIATIYLDWKTRHKWGPRLAELEEGEKIIIDTKSGLDWLRHEAVKVILQADNDAAKIGAIRTAERLLIDGYELARDVGKINVVPRETMISQKQPFIIKMWKPSDDSTATRNND